MILRAFGYIAGDDEASKPHQLSEVTLAADSETLRQLADFLNNCASLMDAAEGRFGHEHFRDTTNVSGISDVIVSAPLE